ncbi:MAG: hypothetical protein OK457_03115, partial [Thaumarchaeota archaeon]|nr:hypothetical protein [Nitrososphaerota archaeon]
SPFVGKLFPRLKTPVLLSIVGVAIQGLGIIGLGYFATLHPPAGFISLLLAVVGLGQGLIWAPLLTIILRTSKPELRGVASGITFMMVYIGFAISIAIVTSVSATYIPSSEISTIYLGTLTNLAPPLLLLFNQGIQLSMLVLGLITFLAVPFLLVVFRKERASQEMTE